MRIRLAYLPESSSVGNKLDTPYLELRCVCLAHFALRRLGKTTGSYGAHKGLQQGCRKIPPLSALPGLGPEAPAMCPLCQ